MFLDIDSGHLVNLYAHNYIEVFSLSPSTSNLIARKFCEEQCILYAGDVRKQNGKFLVVSGTVFRSILVWEVDPQDADFKNQKIHVPVQHRLLGHTGVIFDTRFFLSHANLQIGSVSDDRSLRIWEYPSDEVLSLGKRSQPDQVRELYGHRSRVWKVRKTQNFYATVSEDATCKLWWTDPKIKESEKPFETLKGHVGKNVRAIATF